MRSNRLILILFVTSLTIYPSGCGKKGPELSPVSGKVTLRGKPVEAGAVHFTHVQGVVDIYAAIQPDGTYSVKMARGSGLPEGKYLVAVGPPVGYGHMGETPAAAPKHEDIPERYQKSSTSGLTLTVGPGSNRFDIDMQ
jgi:hypothetical protein